MMKYYEVCKDCPYYYGEVDQCMYGEEDVPDNLGMKCKESEQNVGKNC